MSDMDVTEQGGTEIAVQSNATYDPASIRGRVRFWLGDSDMECPTFADDDIDSFLYEAGYTGDTTASWKTTPDVRLAIFLAVSIGFEKRANDMAPLAERTKTGVFSTDTQTAFEDMQERAEHFRQLACRESPALVGTAPPGCSW